jgi:hypothetical protein
VILSGGIIELSIIDAYPPTSNRSLSYHLTVVIFHQICLADS